MPLFLLIVGILELSYLHHANQGFLQTFLPPLVDGLAYSKSTIELLRYKLYPCGTQLPFLDNDSAIRQRLANQKFLKKA